MDYLHIQPAKPQPNLQLYELINTHKVNDLDYTMNNSSRNASNGDINNIDTRVND